MGGPSVWYARLKSRGKKFIQPNNRTPPLDGFDAAVAERLNPSRPSRVPLKSSPHRRKPPVLLSYSLCAAAQDNNKVAVVNGEEGRGCRRAAVKGEEGSDEWGRGRGRGCSECRRATMSGEEGSSEQGTRGSEKREEVVKGGGRREEGGGERERVSALGLVRG
ncbi:hypothetical protein MUK42_33723 [Musa troglodytarum]|uniref:Uncharacterized protein n=1 Tax=Musa troglodytarum TaxID=320322 RepID=A0A9E7EAE0_9LILI|nr:hypothetical protein MUK42_33723 [Musa troglodytarum]